MFKVLIASLFFHAGIDLGTDLPTLLNALVAVLPEDRSTMLRIGMTNPPYILKHLESIAAILNHPCVYSFLHVPVQSGSDNVLRVSFPTLNVYASWLSMWLWLQLPYHSPISLRYVGVFWLCILVLLIKIYLLKLVLHQQIYDETSKTCGPPLISLWSLEANARWSFIEYIGPCNCADFWV